jgi:hypothetical protein
MKAHDSNRKDIASLNASVLPTMPPSLEQPPPADVTSILECLATSGQQGANN